MYEMGIASSMASRKAAVCEITHSDIESLHRLGFEDLFLESMTKIYSMNLYDEFIETGWNRKLVLKTKKKLIPEIIRVVMLGWYQAIEVACEGNTE